MDIWHRLLPGCPEALARAASAAYGQVQPFWQDVDRTVMLNQAKVLRAFHGAGISDTHFAPSSGYGYSDTGRERIDQLFAGVFGAQAGLVRVQFASGTHAIACALFGLLRPGDLLLSAAGTPYDTLRQVIGGGAGSLQEWGVRYREVPLLPDGSPDTDGVARAAAEQGAKVVFIQRSRGYSLRPSLTVDAIGKLIAAVKAAQPGALCVIDNCYGEFVEDREPSEVGADLVCGSLIKNPGGGLAPTGGYLVGHPGLIEQAASRLIAPGIGMEVGANLGANRLILQGLFLAPHVTGEALKGALFTAAFFERLGFRVRPRFDQPRTDLVQAVELGRPEALTAFCEAVQSAGPVDAHVRPEPWEMPGYSDPVIMAAGTFVQGSSIELSADGPMRPPYTAYFQGGLTREHVILAALRAANEMARRNILRV